MDHHVLELPQIIDMPVTVHGLRLLQVIFYQVNLIEKGLLMGNKKKTYEMGFFDGSSLPDYDGRTELADNVPLVQLIDVRSHIIGFT